MQGDSKASADEVLAQLRYLQTIYTQQYDVLANEMATFSLALGALQRNIEMLEKKAVLENSNVLMSGEGGAYIKAKIEKMEKALVYVGGGYLVEKDTEEAKQFLKDNYKKQEDTLKKLSTERTRIEKELVDIAYKLSVLEHGMQR